MLSWIVPVVTVVGVVVFFLLPSEPDHHTTLPHRHYSDGR